MTSSVRINLHEKVVTIFLCCRFLSL